MPPRRGRHCGAAVVRSGKLNQGFPLALNVGKHGYSHDDAPKKETTPIGITVVSKKQGFRPAHPSAPKSTGKEQS
jgi:hypothetical protein